MTGGALRLAAGLALWAAAGVAQTFPERARVSGVAAGDVLNIRAEPSAGAAILGSLPPGAEGVEVLGLSPDGRWAQVPLPEGGGWVARRYLQIQPLPRDALPRPLRCIGTEPFWSLQIDDFGGRWSTPEVPEAPVAVPRSDAAPEGWLALIEDPQRGHSMTLTVTRAACSDGMSDRPFGLAAVLFDQNLRGGPNRIWQGCCTLDSR